MKSLIATSIVLVLALAFTQAKADDQVISLKSLLHELLPSLPLLSPEHEPLPLLSLPHD